MASALEELMEVIPPPNRPYRTTGDWSAVEATLGSALPSEFKAFIGVYGSGTFNGTLEISNPLDVTSADPSAWWYGMAGRYEDFAPIPYPVFPAAGGLLPFGMLGDLDTLNWLTIGPPDSWPFVYFDRDSCFDPGGGFFEVRGLSAIGFVLEAVTRRSPLLRQLGHDRVFAKSPVFKPPNGSVAS